MQVLKKKLNALCRIPPVYHSTHPSEVFFKETQTNKKRFIDLKGRKREVSI